MSVHDKASKFYLIIVAIAGAFALLAQLYLSLHTRTTTLAEAIIRYFSFFTILTNILVTVCAAAILLKPGSLWGRFFSKASTLSAITVYIIVVALIYNLVLRQLWNPTGLQRVADELLHVIIPILFLLFWVLYVPKHNLGWNVLWWLIYPFVYGVYSIIRGALTGFYPYSFMDAGRSGYPHILVNMIILLIIFLGLSLSLVAIGKFISPKKNT